MRVRELREQLDLRANRKRIRCTGRRIEAKPPLDVSPYPLLGKRDQALACGWASASAKAPSASCIQSVSSRPACEKSDSILSRSYL